MKRFLSASFRNRLFTALLAASLIPLLICSAVLLQIFRLQMTSREEHEAEVSLGEASQILTRTRDSLLDAAEAVASDGIISAALSESRRDDAAVYKQDNDGLFDIEGKKGTANELFPSLFENKSIIPSDASATEENTTEEKRSIIDIMGSKYKAKAEEQINQPC